MAQSFLCLGMEGNYQRAVAGRGGGSQNFFSQLSSGELSLNRCVQHIMQKVLCRKINFHKTYFHDSFPARRVLTLFWREELKLNKHINALQIEKHFKAICPEMIIIVIRQYWPTVTFYNIL